MSLLIPPICLQYTCILNGGDPLNLDNPNLYWCTFNNIVPQTTGITGQYDGTSINVGMYCTSNTDGYIFRITRILTDPIPNSQCVDVIIEDINGFNVLIDPNGGLQGGAPATASIGYVFQINPYTKLPILTSINNTPTLTFSDSILGRFIYDQTDEIKFGGPTGSGGGNAGPTGPTGPSEKFSFSGPTGSILFYDGNSITGTSNVTYITNTEGTGTINISNLVIENIIFSGTGTADLIIDNLFGCIIHLKAKKTELMKIMDDYFKQKITRIETTNRLALLNSTIA
jgi:hypothetical protein